MADIDYEAVKLKVNELTTSALNILNMNAALACGTLYNVSLTQSQIDDLKNGVKAEGDNLKTIVGAIKGLLG